MSALLEYLIARGIERENLNGSGIDSDRIEQLYSDAEPTIEEVRTLARKLRVPARELIVPLRLGVESRAKLRSNFNFIKDDLGYFEACSIENRLNELSDILKPIEEIPFFVDFPKDANSAEQLAMIFRSSLLGIDYNEPLLSLPQLIFDRLGVVTFLFRSRIVEGASYRNGGSAIVAIAERNDIRMLYTLAHEICHLLVDIDNDPNATVWIDENVFTSSAKDVRESEFFANEFAACLLIPAGGLVAELKRLRMQADRPEQLVAYEIAAIARKFGTSFVVAARRCESLMLLDRGGSAILDAEIQGRFGSAEKFADSFGIPPRGKIDWHYPAKITLEALESRLLSGDLSVTRVHELLGIKLV
ncbi:MAG: ImmA/IrrE family metallo-endopeptidase [Allorhizobium sp.]|uniref:ImmA/IrrE family metallo-endopeptidase n=1 Tax=Allorhizobium sp. TaxID=633478 RepID=UPI0040333AC4